MLNVGRLAGETAVNAIAPHAQAVIEARSPEEHPLGVLAGLLGEYADRCRLDVTVDASGHEPMTTTTTVKEAS